MQAVLFRAQHRRLWPTLNECIDAMRHCYNTPAKINCCVTRAFFCVTPSSRHAVENFRGIF